MNYLFWLLEHFKQKTYRKFLLILSICTITLAGVVLACGDGGYYDDYENSSFTPEAFVDAQYSPFFFTRDATFYTGTEDPNTSYNQQIIEDWDSWFEHRIDTGSLKILLFKSTAGSIDSASRYYRGKLKGLVGLPDLKKSNADKKKVNVFFDYLLLAKECEIYSIRSPGYWTYEKVSVVPKGLEDTLIQAVSRAKDPFIKERLWFQTVRYYYFKMKNAYTIDPQMPQDVPLVAYFYKQEASFPKNMIYYRALGYLAGYYYECQEYAKANYLYSLCYNYSFKMKMPSKWSFHPQNEKDWIETLNLAKTDEEKVTLWHMLGSTRDEARAIKEIYEINPKSEKLDLLLSRLVNIRESLGQTLIDTGVAVVAQRTEMTKEKVLINKIANENKTLKPYYWYLAAGYLSSLSGENSIAKTFYDRAKKQTPKSDTLVMAQVKILDWLLYLRMLKHIDSKTEAEMVEPLNWLNSLSKNKKSIPNLRFNSSIGQSMAILSAQYKKQGDLLKSYFFNPYNVFYNNNGNIEAAKALLSKKDKTPFEQSMLNYYSINIGQLNYFKAILLVYQEKLDEAISLLKRADKSKEFEFEANPFNIKIHDCHDCDYLAERNKNHLSGLSFVETLRKIKKELKAGRNVSRNAALMANAYYNITYFGNGNSFYYKGYFPVSDKSNPYDIAKIFANNKIAEKYYLLARANAKTNELKTKFTYMAAKCERNENYNLQRSNLEEGIDGGSFPEIPAGKYFAQLKDQYSNTKYYQEILNECGYFKTYSDKRQKVQLKFSR